MSEVDQLFPLKTVAGGRHPYSGAWRVADVPVAPRSAPKQQCDESGSTPSQRAIGGENRTPSILIAALSIQLTSELDALRFTVMHLL